MAPGIVKIGEDEYFEWSTIADAPTTHLMTRSEAVKRYGEPRVSMTDRKGTSWFDVTETAEEFVRHNRAGPNEECLTLEELREQYKPR